MLGHDMNTVAPSNALVGGMHGPTYTDPAFQNPLVAPLQSSSMQPAYTQGWQQSFHAQNMMNLQAQSRMGMGGFGTDARFLPTGYAAAPHNPMDPDLPQGLQMTNPLSEWLEPTSASTTQPNTQPNTQPSSPNWSKKRNFDDFARDQQPRNDFMAAAQQAGFAHPSPPQSNPRRKRSVVKNEAKSSASHPHTPLSNSKPQTPLESEYPDNSESPEQDEDAEAEDEDEDGSEQPRSPSPAPWPGSRPRPPKNTKAPPPKPPRKKKVNVSASKPKKPPTSQKSSSSRVPLSIEQKKANHTNSEQRRRDATARSYAELYDLVPELEDIGKQSTMKKLEVVVAKVRQTKEAVERIRVKLGMDPKTGRPLDGAGGTIGGMPHYDGGGRRQ